MTSSPAVAVRYEAALLMALALRRRAGEHHSSGAWNALGAAAVGDRLLGLDPSATAHGSYTSARDPWRRRRPWT